MGCKEFNYPPVGAKKPLLGKELNMKITQQRMTMVFNEWAKRYAENPNEFTSILDDDGNPIADYGESCTRYFTKLAGEMDSKGILPKPS